MKKKLDKNMVKTLIEKVMEMPELVRDIRIYQSAKQENKYRVVVEVGVTSCNASVTFDLIFVTDYRILVHLTNFNKDGKSLDTQIGMYVLPEGKFLAFMEHGLLILKAYFYGLKERENKSQQTEL